MEAAMPGSPGSGGLRYHLGDTNHSATGGSRRALKPRRCVRAKRRKRVGGKWRKKTGEGSGGRK